MWWLIEEKYFHFSHKKAKKKKHMEIQRWKYIPEIQRSLQNLLQIETRDKKHIREINSY